MAAVVILFYGFLASSGWYPAGAYDAMVPAWAACLAAGALASVIEAVSKGFFDNLAVPLLVTLAMVLLGM